MESTDIFLDSESSGVRQVKVAPVVLFNVLDHFIRRSDSKQRVIGSLLGKATASGVVHITDSFPLPHSETGDDEVAIESDYFAKMHELQRRVSPNEILVGWYATNTSSSSTEPDLKSIIIHEFYARQCANPVHVLVDTALGADRMDVRAFVSTSYTIAQLSLSSELQAIPVVVSANKAERVGLDALLSSSSSSSSSLPLQRTKKEMSVTDQVENLQNSLKKLLNLLDTVGRNVDAVVTGKIEGDINTGKFLAETLTMVPRMNNADFERLFGDNMRDLLMVTYLCKLAKSQLTVGEKLLAIDVPSLTAAPTMHPSSAGSSAKPPPVPAPTAAAPVQ